MSASRGDGSVIGGSVFTVDSGQPTWGPPHQVVPADGNVMSSSDFEHPYSDTATIGDAVFVSGCLPIDEEENLVEDRKEALDAALATVGRRLRTIGLTLSNVVKLTYYVTDLGDRALANEQFVATWDEPRPARTIVQVAGLPRGASVEIDAIARRV
jgi:enamine deaminase RidA (YjgF/YER057c/UK114 family)